MTSNRQLTNVSGTLKDAYLQLRPDTIQHSDEIQKARLIDDTGLRNRYLWTADFALYGVEEGNVVLYLARGEHNLIFQNIEEATDQLTNTGNYVVRAQDSESIVNAESTLRVDISNLLRLKWISGTECSSVELDKWALEKGRRAIMEQYGKAVTDLVYRVHGKDGITDLVSKKEKPTTRIVVLHPGTIENHPAVREGNLIARVCGLLDFNEHSNFDASDRRVIGSTGVEPDALRGILANH